MQVEQLKNYKSDSPDVRSRLNPQKSAFSPLIHWSLYQNIQMKF